MTPRRALVVRSIGAQRLFVRLVNVGTDSPDTRRRVSLDSLVGLLGDREVFGALLDQFVNARLITVDTGYAVISHESLIRHWPRLRAWIDEDRARSVAIQRLVDLAHEWQRDKDPTLLLRGSRLSSARDYGEASRDHLPAVAGAFLDASVRHHRQGVRRLQQTIAALVTLLLLAVGGGLVALQQRGVAVNERAAANAERNRAISRLVANNAGRLRDKDVTLAAALGLAAYRIWPTYEARSALIESSATFTAARIFGSTGVMQAVAVSPDGRLLAGGTADKTVAIWDLAQPDRPVRTATLHEPRDVVYSVAFSPDGRLLAAGSGDGHVYLYRLTTAGNAVPLVTISDPGGVVYSVAFDRSGGLLAAASSDLHLYLWDMAEAGSPQLRHKLLGGYGYVQAVAFSAAGDKLAAGTQSGAVLLWKVDSPEHLTGPQQLAAGPEETVLAIAFSPDGSTLAAGSKDGTIHLWRLDGVSPTIFGQPLRGTSGWVNALAFSPDGTSLAASTSGQAWIWDWARQRVAARLPHPTTVTSLAFGHDPTTLVTAAVDGMARLWTLRGPTVTDDDVLVNNVHFNSDGTLLAVASGHTRLLNVHTRAWVGAPMVPKGRSTAVRLAPDGRNIYIGDRVGRLYQWSLASIVHPLPTSEPIEAHDGVIESIALSPDGKVMATAGDDHRVRLWDGTGNAPRPHSTLTEFDNYVYSVAFSGDGRLLAGASIDNTVRLWKVADPDHPVAVGSALRSSDTHALSVAFSPDSKSLAVGSADKKIYLWDIANPEQPRLATTLVGPSNWVYAIAYSLDGHTLAAASTDGSVWLWEASDALRPVLQAALTQSAGPIYTVAFSPDGLALAAGGGGKTVWFWDLDLDRIAGQICRSGSNPITDDEWKQYVPDTARTDIC